MVLQIFKLFGYVSKINYTCKLLTKNKNMKIKLFLIAIISVFTFSSCEKCKDCEPNYEFINGADPAEADALAILLGYSSFDNLFHSTDSINQLNKEYCEDELTDKQDYSDGEDWDGDGVDDIRYFYDCK